MTTVNQPMPILIGTEEQTALFKKSLISFTAKLITPPVKVEHHRCYKCRQTLPLSCFGLNKSGKRFKGCDDCRAISRAYDRARALALKEADTKKQQLPPPADTAELQIHKERVMTDLDNLLTRLILRHETADA